MRPNALVPTLLVVAAIMAVSGGAAAHPVKGEGPTAIAAAFGSVWVGMGSGDILRIDANTGRVQTRFRNTGFVHALAAGFRSIWALQDRVVRVDPRSGFAHELPDTGYWAGFNLEVGAGAVWVADDGRNVIDRIDPLLERRVARIRIPGRAFGLAAHHGHVLVVSVPTSGPVTGPAGTRQLRLIDAVTNRVSRPLVRLECDPTIAFAPNVVWTVDPCVGSLAARSPTTLASTKSRRIARWKAPVAAFRSLWLVGARWTARRDPRTLRVIARIRVGGVVPVAGEGALWFLDYRGRRADVVHKVDPRTNRVAATIRIPTP